MQHNEGAFKVPDGLSLFEQRWWPEDDLKGIVAKELYARAQSVDKTIKLYDGFFHEALNELNKEQVRK